MYTQKCFNNTCSQILLKILTNIGLQSETKEQKQLTQHYQSLRAYNTISWWCVAFFFVNTLEAYLLASSLLKEMHLIPILSFVPFRDCIKCICQLEGFNTKSSRETRTLRHKHA